MLTGMTSRAQGLAYLAADSTGGSCQPRLIQMSARVAKVPAPPQARPPRADRTFGWTPMAWRHKEGRLFRARRPPVLPEKSPLAATSAAKRIVVLLEPTNRAGFLHVRPRHRAATRRAQRVSGGVAGGRGRSCVPLHTARFRPAARLRRTDCGADFTNTSRDPGVTRSHGRACPAPLRRPSAPTQCLRRPLGEPAANPAASRAMKYPCDP
jgi:hypothetical protein